jgi:arylsulfatase A-like enzyme
VRRKGEIEEFAGDWSEIAVNEAVNVLRRHRAGGQPMFAVIWFGSPHSPFKSSPEDKAPFASLDEASANHYGELVALDRSIGGLRKSLRDLGIAEQTLLVFCSDNGGLPGIEPPTVGGLRGAKGTVYEGGLRVPGIFEWPGVIAPRVTDDPASTMDLFPTVADLLDLPESVYVQPVDGESLEPLFSSDLDAREKPIPFRFGSRAALVAGRYKLLTDDVSGGSFQLYDIEADPSESRDVAAEQPDRHTEMVRELRAWNASVEASLAGRDYPGERVDPADPEPRSWVETPAYQPYLPRWKDRWEYRAQIEGRGRSGRRVRSAP